MDFLDPTKPFSDLKAVFNEKKKNPFAPLNPKQISNALTTRKSKSTGERKSLLLDS